jgi:hypothetical protein
MARDFKGNPRRHCNILGKCALPLEVRCRDAEYLSTFTAIIIALLARLASIAIYG